jgi:hypothetical protein
MFQSKFVTIININNGFLSSKLDSLKTKNCMCVIYIYIYIYIIAKMQASKVKDKYCDPSIFGELIRKFLRTQWN